MYGLIIQRFRVLSQAFRRMRTEFIRNAVYQISGSVILRLFTMIIRRFWIFGLLFMRMSAITRKITHLEMYLHMDFISAMQTESLWRTGRLSPEP